MKTMKKLFSLALCITLVLSVMLCAVGCTPDRPDPETLWDGATYKEDTVLGDGEKTVVVEVVIEEHSVKFTIHTDKVTVGEALIEHGIVEGDEGAYGLYVKKVNGILADYDVDQTYWEFYINGDYALSGIELTEINESDEYKIVYTK